MECSIKFDTVEPGWFIVYFVLDILKELKKNATDKNIIFACLNDGLVKSLSKISY